MCSGPQAADARRRLQRRAVIRENGAGRPCKSCKQVLSQSARAKAAPTTPRQPTPGVDPGTCCAERALGHPQSILADCPCRATCRRLPRPPSLHRLCHYGGGRLSRRPLPPPCLPGRSGYCLAQERDPGALERLALFTAKRFIDRAALGPVLAERRVPAEPTGQFLRLCAELCQVLNAPAHRTHSLARCGTRSGSLWQPCAGRRRKAPRRLGQARSQAPLRPAHPGHLVPPSPRVLPEYYRQDAGPPAGDRQCGRRCIGPRAGRCAAKGRHACRPRERGRARVPTGRRRRGGTRSGSAPAEQAHQKLRVVHGDFVHRGASLAVPEHVPAH